MRQAGWLIGILAIIPLGTSAGEKPPAKAQDNAAFSQLVHRIVVKRIPKEGFEDTSGWGMTVPIPPKLRLPNLRTYIKVGDHLELPHGAWRRFKGKIEDPDKDLKIVVKEFKALNESTYRLVMDVDALIVFHGEWQQWQKGLLIIGAEAAGDANVTAAIVCDVKFSFDFKKFPPGLNVEPTVTELGLNLVDVKLRNPDGGKNDKAIPLNNEIKELLNKVLKAAEPMIKSHANQVIAQSLKEGKGSISADAVLKALPKK
jgi:hypothetical protein